MKRILLGASIDAIGASRLPEVLAEAGCEVTAVCHPRIALRWSCFAHHVASGRSPQEVRTVIERLVEESPAHYKCVIITDEPLLREFIARPAALGVTLIAPQLSSIEKLNRTLSKVYFTMDASQRGIPVPASRPLGGSDDLRRETWQGVPFVLKNEEGFNGSGVLVIRSKEDLSRAQSTLHTWPVLLQTFVTGRIGATAVLFDHGRPACWYSYFLARNWPNPTAPASAIEPCTRPEMEDILIGVGRMTGFDGLCGLDWALEDKTGRTLLLEMNPRPTPGLHASRIAGVSFSRAIADWLDGTEATQRPSEDRVPMYRLFPQNLFPAIRDRDIGEFCRTWPDAPFHCPGLLLALSRRVLTHHLPKPLRRTKS